MLGVPRIWVGNTVSHLKNRILTKVKEAQKKTFAVAYTPRWNSTCERMVTKEIRNIKSILSEDVQLVSG